MTLGDDLLSLPVVGERRLRILSPSALELSLVTTKRPDGPTRAPLDRWDFVNADSTARLPASDQFNVKVNGSIGRVKAVGFKRRVLYAPLKVRDLRIGNWLYLRLGSPVPE